MITTQDMTDKQESSKIVRSVQKKNMNKIRLEIWVRHVAVKEDMVKETETDYLCRGSLIS